MRLIKQLSAICGAALLLAAACLGQGAATKKAHTFRGKVTAVNASEKTLTVDGEEVEGWMGAMTMDYKVDDPAVLKKLKAGDQITATVYDGDPVLHKVQVAPKTGGAATNK
jgi:Cu/Ag efflux protein CusF